MLIQCTRKLLDELKVEPAEPVEEPLFSWHANIIRLNRRKTVVLVNDQNRYTIVLYGLKAKDFRDFDKLVIEAIRGTFRYEQISEETIDKYLGARPEIFYGKTKNRSMTGRLRSACDVAQYYAPRVVEGSISQPAMSAECSTYMFLNESQGQYVKPNREMYTDLSVLTGKSIFSCKAVQLKVILELGKHNAWRRLIVPVDCTFADFHRIIQKVFEWKDWHLHEFYVFDHTRQALKNLGPNHPAFHPKGYKPIIKLVGDESAFEYEDGIPMQLDHTATLGEYVYDFKIMNYVYDFGDDWRHTIEVEQTITLEDKNFPVCLEGEGCAPPEDVGGIHGYEEFLRIIADEDDPDREDMLAWAKSQGYIEFDIDSVNRWLRAYG